MYFWTPKSFKLLSGERFATCVDRRGVPAYYPTSYILDLRHRAVSHETMQRHCKALAHLDLICSFENLDLLRSMECGNYPSDAEIDNIAELSGIKTRSLRQRTLKNVSNIIKLKAFSRDDLVSSESKAVRLSVFASFLDMIGRMAEAHVAKSSPSSVELAKRRQELTERLKFHRPKIRDLSRTGGPSFESLGLVAAYLLSFQSGSPVGQHWDSPALNSRNQAMLRILIETGIRNSELRQLKVEDVDLNRGVLTVFRRPDDPEDPRLREPNAKTHARHIPISEQLCEFIEDYLLEHGTEVAQRSGSPFLFLSHSNRNLGAPIDGKTVFRVVAKVGEYLGIKGLSPHDLRHSWIQNLADWSISEGISSNEFKRFADYLGGWSYLSDMAANYRGDQLTKYAFEKGFNVERARQ